MKERCRVLLVGRDRLEVDRLDRHLIEAGASDLFVSRADRASIAIDILRLTPFDVVLLDLEAGDGFGDLRALKDEFPDLPIVVRSASLEDDGLAAIEAGAQDVLGRIESGSRDLVRVVRFAIARQRVQSAIRDRSMTDEMTGLFNRRGFLEVARRRLARARRKDEHLYLLFADLDGLKEINDSLGHEVGDQAIGDAAEVLRQTFRTTDIIGRLGGDEFVVLLTEALQGDDRALAARLEWNVAAFNRSAGRTFRLSLSSGSAHFDPRSSASIEDIVRRADGRMYDTKRLKRGSIEGRRRARRLERA